MQSIVFDIETGPAMDFEPADLEPMPPFDPGSVKHGNTKDPEKIKAKVDEARKEYDAKVAKYDDLNKAHKQEQIDDACLSALTGRVLAIGFERGESTNIWHDLPESTIINNFWDLYRSAHSSGARMVGFRILKFDLLFLHQRSIILGITPPDTLVAGRYWCPTFICLGERWMGGSLMPFPPSLDSICEALGVPGKPVLEDGTKMGGGDFWKYYLGSPTDREIALEYLRGDIRMTRELARRLGV